MTTRPVRVYRLDITYPEGSRRPGWEPEGWEPGDYQITTGDDAGSWERGEFRWPAERSYLSPAGAEHRAGLLRKWGAKVTVVPSLPVQWPAQALAGGDE